MPQRQQLPEPVTGTVNDEAPHVGLFGIPPTVDLGFLSLCLPRAIYTTPTLQ